jgi:hypothetical protein
MKVNTDSAMKPNSFRPIPEWKYRLLPGAPWMTANPEVCFRRPI